MQLQKGGKFQEVFQSELGEILKETWIIKQKIK